MVHTRDEMEVEKNTQIVPELVHNNVGGVKQVRCRVPRRGWFWMAGPVNSPLTRGLLALSCYRPSGESYPTCTMHRYLFSKQRIFPCT